jgi:hypothetical protein
LNHAHIDPRNGKLAFPRLPAKRTYPRHGKTSANDPKTLGQFLPPPGDAPLATDGAASASQRLVRRAPSRPSSDAEDGLGAAIPDTGDQFYTDSHFDNPP